MRKKTVARAAALFAAILLTGMLTGCGEQKNQESGESGQASESPAPEKIALKDLDVDKYVTLGDYKGVRVEKTEAKVDESEVDELYDQVYIDSFPEELGVKDREVQTGDTANINYSGKKDGVAFDGGTAEGYNLTIGSHSFIDGFEDGLVGVKPGETVDLNLKFPDSYKNNPDLAGKDVVFTVTVNYIIPKEKMDEAVKNFGVEEVTNLKELRQYIYDYLYETAQSEAEDVYGQKVMDAFLATCEFKDIPQEYVDSYREATKQNITSVAQSYGVDAETYIYYIYQLDMQTFLTTYCDNAFRQNIAIQALANREGMAVSDDELNETLKQYADEGGFDSIEDFLGGVNIEEYREYFVFQKVYDYLMEIAAKAD